MTTAVQHFEAALAQLTKYEGNTAMEHVVRGLLLLAAKVGA